MEFNFGENTEVTDLTKVPTQFHGLYAEADGKFKLRDAPEVKGAVEAILGLNKALVASRAEAKAAKGKAVDISALKDFGATPEEIKAAVDAKLKELTDELAKGDKAKLNLDKIKADLAAAHSNDLKSKDTRIGALTGQLYNLLVENAATSAVAEAKGVPDLLLPFVKQQVKVVEEDGQFQVYVVDGQGDRRYSGITGQPMTIKELVAEMKSNEKYGRLFESEAPQGQGTPPGQQRRAGQIQTGATLTPLQKIQSGLNKGQFQKGLK